MALLAAAALVDPWGLLRVTTLRWAVVSTAIAVAAVAVAVGGYRPRLPRPVAAVGVGTLALVGVATVLADDRATALVGHPRRNLGLLAWVGFAAATAVGAALPWRPRIVGAAVTAAGLAITAGAAADLAGWSPGGADFAGGRVGGLSGQPAYLGSLALLVGVAAAGA
ncbi:MAG: hypothetical protein S0880_02320, partial [Actinomycetota bacterium]|nr:hypothetical protein [Actinomycetota bacterium]